MQVGQQVAYQHNGEVSSHTGTIMYVQNFLGFKKYLVQWHNGGSAYWYFASNLKAI